MRLLERHEKVAMILCLCVFAILGWVVKLNAMEISFFGSSEEVEEGIKFAKVEVERMESDFVTETQPASLIKSSSSESEADSVEASRSSSAPSSDTVADTEAIDISEVQETVYATMNVNVRTEPSVESEKVGLLCGGQSIERTGILSNGWSRVVFGEEERFIHSNYLTTVKPSGYSGSSSESGQFLGTFKITAYCGGSCCNGGWAEQTSTGVAPREGRTIAVAPWVIPYGSKVKIEGLDETYIAEDTGGFANRNDRQIDLFMEDHSRTGAWGVQHRRVWIVD